MMPSRPTIALISCTRRKSGVRSTVRDLYAPSQLFSKSLAYAERGLGADVVLVLSAEHGVLSLNDVLDPYERSLRSIPKLGREGWGMQVVADLRQRFTGQRPSYVGLAGRTYLDPLRPHIARLDEPLAGMGIGKRLRWLNENTPD